jgi:hypothetical protein
MGIDQAACSSATCPPSAQMLTMARWPEGMVDNYFTA